MMDGLFRFPGAMSHDPDVEAWLNEQSGELGNIARCWFSVIRNCGEDVRELIHDGRPTACVGDAAFAYVDVYKAHVNVGFFHGVNLDDPSSLLQGSGKAMRHVKLRPFEKVEGAALQGIIVSAFSDMKDRINGQ